MRDSIESPVFGSKVESYQSQRNMLRGLTITSKDELEQAVSKKPTGTLQKRFENIKLIIKIRIK